jgi:two-component system response regulator RegA
MSRTAVGEGQTLLIAEDDDLLRERLTAALKKRGFDVLPAASLAEAQAHIQHEPPELALVDLRLGEDSGLELVRILHQADPTTQIVVLTGYGSIATALEAMSRGATWYLTKPSHADDILAAFARGDAALRERMGLPKDDDATAEPGLKAPSLARMEWEHIQRVLNDCGGNITHAAEALGIHRRSLQRKLSKRPGLR